MWHRILTYPEGQLYCFLSLNKDKIWFAGLNVTILKTQIYWREIIM